MFLFLGEEGNEKTKQNKTMHCIAGFQRQIFFSHQKGIKKNHGALAKNVTLQGLFIIAISM